MLWNIYSLISQVNMTPQSPVHHCCFQSEKSITQSIIDPNKKNFWSHGVTAEVTFGDREECWTKIGMLGISPNCGRKQIGNGTVYPLPFEGVRKFALMLVQLIWEKEALLITACPRSVKIRNCLLHHWTYTILSLRHDLIRPNILWSNGQSQTDDITISTGSGQVWNDG